MVYVADATSPMLHTFFFRRSLMIIDAALMPLSPMMPAAY